MNNFNISFKFVDNLGETTITHADHRWNGVTVFVSKSQFQKLSPAEKLNILTHECNHAVVGYGLDQFSPEECAAWLQANPQVANPKGWDEVDGVKLPSVETWAEPRRAVAEIPSYDEAAWAEWCGK